MDDNRKKAKGHCCCVCQNTSGVVVNGKKISLHRFPADQQVAKVWRSRCKLVLKRFVHSQNSRLCSAHFLGGEGPKKPYVTVPTLFSTKQFKNSMVVDVSLPSIDDEMQDSVTGCGQFESEPCKHPHTIKEPLHKPAIKVHYVQLLHNSPVTCSQEQNAKEPLPMPTTRPHLVSLLHNSSETYRHQPSAKEQLPQSATRQRLVSLLHNLAHNSPEVLKSPSSSSAPPTNLQFAYSCTSTNSSNGVRLCTVSTQTTISYPKTVNTGINCDLKQCVDKCSQTHTATANVYIQVDRPPLTVEDVQDDPKLLKYYTGIPNKETFYVLFDGLSSDPKQLEAAVGKRKELRYIDEFFLVLMRLRMGALLQDLAVRFRIGQARCCQLFSAWIQFLVINLTPLIVWPTREQVKAAMPRAFRAHFPNCRIVIDCTEIFTQRPSSLVSQTLTYSHYKRNMTWKALIGTTPNGVLSFVSDLWLGSISDQQIVEQSGLLDLLEEGDSIMGDKGFDMSKITTEKGIDLIIPPKKNKRKKMTALEIIKTRRIASQRIHVERYMSRVKTFRILGDLLSTTGDPNTIWKICNALTMLYPPLNESH